MEASETLKAIAPFAQLLVAIIALVTSTGVAIWVARSNKQTADLQYWRAASNAWLDLDKFALSSDDNLAMVDSLFHPGFASQSMEDRRKRWFGYMAINVFLSTYVSPTMKTLYSEELKRELGPLMRDNIIYDVTQSGIYEPEFTRFCRELRKEQGLPTA